MTREEWQKEAIDRYGPDIWDWCFICPSCGHAASILDWKKAGAPSDAVAFSCVGRWLDAGSVAAEVRAEESTFKRNGGPCSYAGGGLIGLNPIEVEGSRFFDFADRPLEPAAL